MIRQNLLGINLAGYVLQSTILPGTPLRIYIPCNLHMQALAHAARSNPAPMKAHSPSYDACLVGQGKRTPTMGPSKNHTILCMQMSTSSANRSMETPENQRNRLTLGVGHSIVIIRSLVLKNFFPFFAPKKSTEASPISEDSTTIVSCSSDIRKRDNQKNGGVG